MWTHFMDMNSGGWRKEDFAHLYIEAPKDAAVAVFFSRYGHDPARVSCTCCGDDYSVSEAPTLEEASRFERRNGSTLATYLARPEVAVIRAENITEEEREADIPQSGWVWVEA